MKKIITIIVFISGLLPLTLKAQTSIDHYWDDGLEYRRYSIMHEKVSDIRIDYLINTPGAANYKCKWRLYSINPDGSSSTQVASETVSKHHNMYINHNFRSSTYWFYIQKTANTNKVGLKYESFDGDVCSDTQISVAPSALIESNAATLSIYYTTRSITLDEAASAYCSIRQKSKVSDSRQIRTVNVYVDGVYVGKQSGNHYFPVRGEVKSSDLSVSIKNPSKYFLDTNKGDGTGIVASGTNYDVYLVQHFTVQGNTANLTVNGTNPQTVSYGYQNTPITFTVVNGYIITGVKVNGAAVSGWTSNSYTYPANIVKENKAIEVATGVVYNVAFNNNGGTGAIDSFVCGTGTSYKVPECAFENGDHPFIGWNTKADGTGIMYQPGEYFKDLTTTPGATVVLYAQWGPVKYSLTITKSGLSGKDNAIFDVYREGVDTRLFRVYVNAANPSVVIRELDPARYIVKETSWSWGYTASSMIVNVSLESGSSTASFVNTPKSGNLPLHDEAIKISWR